MKTVEQLQVEAEQALDAFSAAVSRANELSLVSPKQKRHIEALAKADKHARKLQKDFENAEEALANFEDRK